MRIVVYIVFTQDGARSGALFHRRSCSRCRHRSRSTPAAPGHEEKYVVCSFGFGFSRRIFSIRQSRIWLFWLPTCKCWINYDLRQTRANSTVIIQAVREAATICPRPLQVDLWPFDLESGAPVTCDVGYLCTNFSHPRYRAYCSRLRSDVRDRRQTSDRQTSDSIIAYNA